MKRNEPTVVIAIAAFNAEQNIQRLLKSLIIQDEKRFKIEKIFVYSDCSWDNTVSLAKTIKDKRIKVIDLKHRAGFANVVKKIIKSNDADYLTLLNDDIIIKERVFISGIMSEFLSDKNVGLVSSNIQPLRGVTFIEKAVISGYSAYKETALSQNLGNNKMTCDGKSLSLSRLFCSKVDLNIKSKLMGNVDSYLFLECLKSGMLYRFARDSKLYFKCPSTIGDFTKWQIRNYSTHHSLIQRYGDLAKKEFEINSQIFFTNQLAEFYKNPIGSLLIFVLGKYCAIRASYSKKFESKWTSVSSTKLLGDL